MNDEGRLTSRVLSEIQRLHDVDAWIKQTKLGTLEPASAAAFLSSFGNQEVCNYGDSHLWHSAMRNVQQLRKSLTHGGADYWPHEPAIDLLKRILLFWPLRSLGDEMICRETHDFFNMKDQPPCMLWFSATDDEECDSLILLSLIPINCVGLVNRAIELDYTDMYAWLV